MEPLKKSNTKWKKNISNSFSKYPFEQIFYEKKNEKNPKRSFAECYSLM